MRIEGLVTSLLLAASLVGCATSTRPGTVGVTRSQLLLVSSTLVNEQAASMYAQQSATLRQSGKLNTDAALTERVRGIAHTLIRHVGAFRADATEWPWEINVFDSDEVNAFCLPGGKIGIYTGFIRKLDPTDDELASVMGHEIAHALREHGREKISQRRLSEAVVQAIAQSGTRNARLKSDLAGLGAQLFVHLPFSREMELESDVMGLELMARAGYDPRRASGLWTKMSEMQGGGRAVEFFRTHPNHDRRIAELDAAVPKVHGLYMAAIGTQGERPDKQLQVNTGSKMQAHFSKETSPQPNSRSTAENLSHATLLPVVHGQDSWSAERLARREGCNQNAKAALREKGPGFESYALTCSNGEGIVIRCEFGNCRIVR